MFRLLAIVLFSTLALASGIELQQRQAAGHLLVTGDPLREAQRLARDGRLDEAALLADFAGATALSRGERDAASTMRSQIEESRTIGRRARSFAAGALTGEPRDLAGFLGSLSLDLFVVGDLRDLAVQGYREVRDGDGDMLILTLSAVGLATTLSPQVDFAPALLKVFRRAGALTERFVKSLSKMGRSAVASGDFSRIGKVAADFGGAARALGPAPLARVMKHVDEPAELSHVSRLARAEPASVYGLTRMTGGRAVKTFGKTADAGAVAKAARRGSRLAKVFAKGVAVMPDWLLLSVFLASCFAAARSVSRVVPRFGASGLLRRMKHRGAPVLTDAVR